MFKWPPNMLATPHRWKTVVHEGIDGFLRLIVIVDCTTDYTAATVLCRLHTAVRRYGLPSRIRCDKGGENTQVALYMLEHPRQGPGRGSIIAGRSIHNQRIEHLWRDVFKGVLKLYHCVFYHLESIGILDSNSDIHLFLIHYVYLPCIRHCLRSGRMPGICTQWGLRIITLHWNYGQEDCLDVPSKTIVIEWWTGGWGTYIRAMQLWHWWWTPLSLCVLCAWACW